MCEIAVGVIIKYFNYVILKSGQLEIMWTNRYLL